MSDNINNVIEQVKSKILLPLLGEKFVKDFPEYRNGLSVLLAGSFLIGYLGCKYLFLGLLGASFYYLKSNGSSNDSTKETEKSPNKSSDNQLIMEEDSMGECASRNDTADEHSGPAAVINSNAQTLIPMKAEKAGWLNALIKDMWPHIAFHIRRVLLEQIQPMVQEMEPKALLSTFKFTEVAITQEAPDIKSIKSYRPLKGNKSESKIILDMDLTVGGKNDDIINCMFSKEILGFKTGIPVGICQLALNGQCRVELFPLLNGPPFFGTMAISFTSIPKITFDLTGVGNFVEIPGLAGIIQSTVEGIFDNLFVKNKLMVPMVPADSELAVENDLKPMDVMHPRPKGCIFAHVRKAENLIAKDNKKAMGISLAKGKSDPYLIVELPVRGNQRFQTKTVKENLNPTWDEKFCFLTDTPSVEKIKIEAWDYDKGTDDDVLGHCFIPCKDFYPGFLKNQDGFPLTGVKHGRVYVDFFYLPVVTSIDKPSVQKCQKTIVSVVVESVSNVPESIISKNSQCFVTLQDKNTQEKKDTMIMRSTERIPFDHEMIYLLENHKITQTIEKEVQLKNAAGKIIGKNNISYNCQATKQKFSEYKTVDLGNGITAKIGIRFFRAVGDLDYRK